MLPKTGKRLPRRGARRPERQQLATEIGKALRAELGGTHRTVKTIMAWTCASERTIKNWLDGSHGPSGEHLIDMIRHSDAVYSLVLRLAGREHALAMVRVADLRARLAAALAEIDRSHQSIE
jgi:hypothetical protein